MLTVLLGADKKYPICQKKKKTKHKPCYKLFNPDMHSSGGAYSTASITSPHHTPSRPSRLYPFVPPTRLFASNCSKSPHTFSLRSKTPSGSYYLYYAQKRSYEARERKKTIWGKGIKVFYWPQQQPLQITHEWFCANTAVTPGWDPFPALP